VNGESTQAKGANKDASGETYNMGRFHGFTFKKLIESIAYHVVDMSRLNTAGAILAFCLIA